MSKQLKALTTLKDALNNLTANSGSNLEYNKGIVVGCVSALMATGYTFDDAIKLVAVNSPKDAKIETFPESWQEVVTWLRSRNQ